MRTDLSSISKISQLFVIGLALIASVITPLTQAGAQDVSARFLADYGNVTVMEVTGNFDQNTPDGTPNTAPRQAIAKEFFRTHKDEYDFVTIFTNFDFTMRPDAIAFYNHIKNDVRGIGQQIYDNSALYGSNGKLQGTIDMGNLLKLANNPLDPKFDFTTDVMIHETLHRWGAYVKFRDWNGTTSEALLGNEKSHWSFLFDSGGSTHYGNKWRDNGDGTFTSTAVRKYYSPMDLYLMGMIDKSKVPPTLLIDNPAISADKLPELGSTISGTARSVTADDIIAVEGERIPNAKDSQKQFKSAFIYVVTPNTFKADDLPALENIRNAYLTRFSILTDGKGLVQVASTPLENLPTNPGVQPSAAVPRTLPPNINDGLNWLINRQQADGSWTDFALTTERDTAESVATLQIFPTAQSQFQTGLNWLGTNGSSTTDYLARRIEARVHAGSDSTAMVQELLASRNSDGGWGGGRNFVSSPIDTALALKALAAAGYSDQTVTGKAITYLQSIQNPDGGWSGDTGTSIIQPTAAVLSAYNAYRKNYDLEAGIGKAVVFLTAKQNSDGGFGNSPSTVYDSSLALMALQSLNSDKTSISKGMSYLLGQQAEDGSWNESPFQTALSMRAVWQATVEPDLSIKAEDISIIPATITSLPTNAVLSATIQNLGRDDVSQAKVSLYEGNIDPAHKLSEQTLAFPGQSSVTVTFSIPVTSATGHVYHVVVDPDNQIKETNKDNNQAAKSLLPEITYDFQILNSDLVVTPNPADAGKDVKISLKVSNRGTSDAYNVPVCIFIDQAGSPVEIAQVTIDVPAGGSVVREVAWRASLAGVNLPLTVQVDPNNTFTETSKDNNKASVPLTVNASTLPNLSVSYKDLVITPSPAREGGNASISVLVKNDGFAAVENVKVNTYKGLASNGGTLLGTQIIPVIVAGQSVRVTTEWQGIAENGERIISVQVDPDSNIQEISKDDNFTFTTLDILSLPDLVISDSSIVIIPAAPKAGDRVSVVVTVQNAGDQEARDVTVQLKEGGTIIGSTVIPLINGNSQTSGTIIYSGSGQTGSHQVAVVIDPDNAIVERTKENNNALKSFSFQNSDLWLSESFISPNGDGIKDSTDFFFRLAVAAKVSVQVVNSKGVAVRTFIGGELDSTTETAITWDGKNDAGSVVDDGTYQITVMKTNGVILASLPMEVDTDRSPLSEALGTKYLLQNNQTCMLPNYSSLKWLPDESGLLLNISPDANSFYLDGIYSMSPVGDDLFRIIPNLWNSNGNPDVSYNFDIRDVSPDGQRIVFDRAKTVKTLSGYYYSWGTQYPNYTYSYVHSLWMVNTDGSNLTQLTEEKQSAVGYNYGFFVLKWSPDGKRIAVVDESGLRVLNPATKVLSEPISGGEYYSYSVLWTQDGTQLVSISSNPSVLAVVDVNGNGKSVSLGRNVTNGTVIGSMANNNILISAYDNDTYNYRLFLFNPVDGSRININIEYQEVPNITISADRRYAAIQTDTKWNDQDSSIMLVDSVGNVSVVDTRPWSGDVPTVGEGENIVGISTSAWLPGGTDLAYMDTRYDNALGLFYDDLVVYNVEMGNKTRFPISKYSLTGDQNYYDYPYSKITQIIIMKDKAHLLLNSGDGAFLLDSRDGSRSDFLPLGTSNFLEFSPNGRYLTYEQYGDSSDSCYPKWNNQWTISSLLNLTADLRIIKNKTVIKLSGVASDKNFAGYRLEYSDIATPDIWNLIMPPSDVPVLSGKFIDWVPPKEGSYYVRLTAWDKAGNIATDRKRVAWGISTLVSGMYSDNEFIAPLNPDNPKKAVTLHYTALDAVHLEFNIVNDKGDIVKSFNREYTGYTVDSITWDGRNEAGVFVPDGKYTIKFFDYEFGVEVDNTLPVVTVGLSAITYDKIQKTYVVSLKASAFDARIKKWEIQTGTGENPQDWSMANSLNINTLIFYSEEKDEHIGFLKNRRFRVVAEDFAGNLGVAISPFVESKVLFEGKEEIDLQGKSVFRQRYIYPENYLSSTGVSFEVGKSINLLGAETLPASTQKIVLQLSYGSVWEDVQEQSGGGSISFTWQHPDNIAKPYWLRFKVITTLGDEYFSNVVKVNENFSADYTCDGLKITNILLEPLQKLDMTITSIPGQSVSVTYDSNIPTGVFDAPVPAASSQPSAYNVTMTGTGVNGTIRSFSNSLLKPECPELKYRKKFFDILESNYGGGVDRSLPFDIIYPKALACGGTSSEIVLPTERLSLVGAKRVGYFVKIGSSLHVIAEVNVELEGPQRVSVDSNLLPSGTYPLSIIVTNMDNSQKQMDLGKMIVFDTEAPQAQLVLPSSPCPATSVSPVGTRQGIELSGTSTDNIKVAHYTLYYGIGENPTSWLPALSVENDGVTKRPIEGDGAVPGRLRTWDITDIIGSVFTVKLEVEDAAGNKGCATGVVKVDREIKISGYNLAPLVFSPNNDGKLDFVTAGLSLDEPAIVNLSAYTIAKDGNNSDVLGLLQRRIQPALNYNGGAVTFDWDGKGDSNTVLSDNRYGISLAVTDVCGNTASQWKVVELDNTPPTVSIDFPLPGNPLPLGVMIEIKGTVEDPHLKSYLLEAGEGDSPAIWRTLTSSDKTISNAVIVPWNTFGLKDRWTLRLTAEDTVGNKKVVTSTIDLGLRKELVKSLDATPKVFSPNNDQKLDSSLISYEVTDACNLRFDLLDENKQIVRTFTDVKATAGNGAIVWDGKNSLGATVADGPYTVKMFASLISNPQVVQSETVTLAVDTVPPTIAFAGLPDKSYFNRTDLSISGTIYDPNPDNYTVSVTGSTGVTILDTGTQNRANYTFGRITDLLEDTYTLAVDANDHGENRAKLVQTFTIDRTPPKVSLEAPKAGTFYGKTENVVDISGAIFEKNLERFSLRYGLGETPTEWKELVGGDAVPTASKLLAWKVGKEDGVPDGVYTLSLYAKDKAGLTGEAKVKLVVDNTPPEVGISQPVDGSYIKPTDIKGTLADANLDKGLLELAEGGCATAVKWAVVKSISTSVQDGALDSWKVLPVDGEYCLRLSGVDKSGNRNETKIGFKIDTHPPTIPELTGKTENLIDNVLSWSKNAEPDLAGYNIYRNSLKINSSVLSEASYRDSGLAEGSYIYTVKTIDFAGNESESSNAVTLKIDLTGPTVRITSPRDGSVISNLVDVKGIAYSQDDFKEYRVYIGQGSSPSSWNVIRRSPLPISFGALAQWDSIAYQDGAQFSIKLEGEDVSGNVSRDQITITVDNRPPSAPVLLTVNGTNSDATLTWKANTEADLAGYLLYRNDQLANVKGIVAGNLKPYVVTGTTYTDKSLADGDYRYYLVALDQAGNSSDQSNTLDVSVDMRPPHMTIIAPASGNKFDGSLMINAETLDNDIATVQFQYKRSQDASWTNLGAPLTKSPFITYLDPKSLGLVYGDYQVQVLAIDKGGKSDLDPPSVTVSYADLTPPDVPSGLAAKVTGGDVSLTWSASSEANVSYNIYRWSAGTRSKINGVPVTTASFADINVLDGTYQYEITSVDSVGNESKASELATAKIYAPIIIQPFTPVKEPTLNLTGTGVSPNVTVEITMNQPSGETAKVSIMADAFGNFTLEGVTLILGENSFTAVASDSNGNISKKSETIFVVFGKVPAAPTGLVSTVLANDVSLNWNANSESDLLGYYIYLDGDRLNDGYEVSGDQLLSSNESSPAVNANDDEYSTYWSSSYSSDGTYSPAWWQMNLSAMELINEVDLEWVMEPDSQGNQTLYAGKDFEVQAWTGHNWVTIKKVVGNDQQSNELLIDPAYRTDRIRLFITATTDRNDSRQVKLRDAYVYATEVNNSLFYNDTNVHGTNHYEVSAVNQYGLESDRTTTIAKVEAFRQTPAGLTVVAPPVGQVLDIAWQPVSEASRYNLYRATTSGGPYLAVRNGLGTPGYRDNGLINGTSYYYVVTALDSVDNESVYSTEAFGTPKDLATSQPLLFKPTTSGVPVTVNKDSVEVSGFAEPEAAVDIKRDSVTLGVSTASSTSQQTDKAMSLDMYYVSLSPDRNMLAGAVHRSITFTDLSNNQVNTFDSPFTFFDETPLWSPSGRYVLFSGYDTSWHNKIAIYDGESRQIQLVATGTTDMEFSASWSSSDDSFVFVGRDADSNNSLWLGSPTDGSVVRLAEVGSVYAPQLSPNNNKIAYVDNNGVLSLMNRNDGAVFVIADNVSIGSLAWSPDGSKLAFNSYRDGDGDIYIYSVASGEITRRTFSQWNGYRVAWSPDSSQVGYTSYPYGNELFTVVDSNGSEKTVFTASGAILGIPEWRSNGDIIVFDQFGQHTIKPAGYFSSTVAGLEEGENRLTAVATDPAGNVSAPSEPISVVLETGMLPDLTVTDSDISFFPPVSKPNEETLVTARVRNLTGNAVDNVKVELYLWDGVNDVTTLASETISHIDAYGEDSVAVRFNVGTVIGSRTVIVVADPSDTIQEVLETNNYAAKDLAITNLEGVRLTATLNSLKSVSNQDLSVNIALLNSGLPTGGVLSVTIEDASGVVVKQLSGQPLELPYGLNESLPFTWNTGATFAGNYRLHALLKNSTTVLAEDAVSFTILPDLTVTARIVTDRQQYGVNQNVGLSASFTNTGMNYLVPQLKAKVRIFDAQNTQLFSGEQFVANIMPGMSGALDFTWNSGLNAPGNYTADVEYSIGDRVAGNASTVFSIIPVASITGSLKASSNIVQPGDAIAVSYTLNNSGNNATTGQALLALVDPDSLSVIATMEQAVSIPMGGTQSGSAVFASSNLLLKPYLVTLTYVSLGSRTPVGTVPVSIKDGIPPVLTVVSPSSGERFAGDVSFSVLASDNASGVARVEYSRDGGAWNVLPPADQSTGRYGFVWTPLATESGAQSVSFRGTDRAGNTSSPLVISFIVQADITPPVLNVSTLADGSFTNNQVLNIAGSVSDDTGVKEVTINGTIITINADGSFSYALQLVPGSNVVEVKASDLAGNSVTNVRTVNLDQKAPLLIILTPADNSKTGTSPMDVTGTVDESSTVTVKVGGVIQTTAMNGNGFASSVTLVPGINTIEVTATDLANNSSSQKRTVIYDDQKPALAISEPGQDIRTNKANVTVRGTVSDPYTEVSITVSVDDQTFTPIVINGGFEQMISLSAEKSYAITVTATNEVGSATSSQRNVIYDITPPIVNIDPVVSPTSQQSQALSGAREEGATIVVSCATATVADIEYPSATTWRTMLSGFTAAGNSVVAIASDAAGNYSTATTAIVYDITPPTGSVVINGGAGITASNQVMLSLAANDESGVFRMRFSNDGSAWSDPETYATTRGWFFTTGDGLKRVHVSYQDMAGNWSIVPIVADIVVDTIPPVVSASPGGGVYNAARIVTLSANESAVIRYTVDGSSPNVTSAIYQTPIQITSDTTLRFMASDSVGNLGDSKTENYIIDTVPPSLTVSTLRDGSYTNNQVLNVAGLATDSSGIVSLTLNGATVSQSQDGSFSQALVLQPGANTVTVVATDLVGNSSTDSRTINLDITSPLLIITTPADNAKTATDIMNVTGTVDETSTVMVKMGTSVQQASLNDTGFSDSITLIPGINTIDVTATDLAGNTSTQKRTVVYDNQKPSLAVTDPPQDIRTNQSGLILRGTVSDPYTQVGVTVTMDGQSHTPQVVSGAFEQQLSFTQEKSYAIVVTATNEVESSATTQRNVIYDITPPTLAINPVQSPTTANSVLISGTRETDIAVTVTCSTATVGTIVYPSASSWEVQLSAMSLGEHIVTAQATDAASNASTASVGVIVQQSGADIVLTPSPAIIWPPNHKMVPVTINGVLNVPLSDIKSLKISLSDEYGEYNFTNLKLGSTVLLEAWRNGNDLDGRKYTFSAVLTRKNGSKATATAVVLVPHDMGNGKCDEDSHEQDGDDEHCEKEGDHGEKDGDDENSKFNK